VLLPPERTNGLTDRVNSFEKAGEAQVSIEDRKNIGKVVLVPEGQWAASLFYPPAFRHLAFS